MGTYEGADDVEVVIATTEAELTTNTAIPYVTSATYDIDPKLKANPRGIGYGRNQDINEGLIDLKGTVQRSYDETLLDGVDAFADLVQSFETGALTGLWMTIKNIITLKGAKFSGVKGHYSNESPEGLVTEKWEWMAETAVRTTT